MARLARILLTIVAGLAVLAVALALLVVETAPRVTGVPVADAEAAIRARDLYREMHRVAADDGGEVYWEVSEGALNGALVAGSRLIPGSAARAEVGEHTVTVDASVPLLRDRLWLNLSGRVGESGGGVVLEEVRVGRLALPPGLVLAAARIGGDRVLGDRLASTALAAVSGLRTEPPMVSVEFDLGGLDREQVADRLREVRSRLAGSGDRDRIYTYLWHLEEARAAGRLPGEGSLAPYLRFTVEQAHTLAGDGEAGSDAEEMRAALYALALHCGDARFGTVVGVTPADRRLRNCQAVELSGRTDLRQHFVLSAGLEAATSASAALGIGELKELLDSAPDGSGFSFDDMAADLAGARFAATLLGLPRERWPAFAAALKDDAAVMPPFADLPSGMPEPEFRERFGDVDSESYRAMLAEIDRRIDALPLHSAPQIN